jgi:hypothetical protein
LVKAFDRCDRTLLWAVMERLGVPPTVLLVLRALHEKADVKFNADGVEQTLPSKIGVKQGGILGPVMFLFLVAGVANGPDDHASGPLYHARRRAEQAVGWR